MIDMRQVDAEKAEWAAEWADRDPARCRCGSLLETERERADERCESCEYERWVDVREEAAWS